MAVQETELQGSWLIVGYVGKPHGVHGDVLVEILNDFPERLDAGVAFGVGGEERPEELFEAFNVRYHKGKWLLSVKGIRDRTTIEAWRGRYLFLPEQSADELPEGYIYEHQMVGLDCVSPAGEALGTVIGLDQSTPAQARLIIRHGQRESMVPYVDEIVTKVDLDKQLVTIDAPAGLLDLGAMTGGEAEEVAGPSG